MWTFSIVDVLLLLLFIVGFAVLCMRDRRILRAIGDIPDQVRILHARHNNYYVQLRQQGQEERVQPSPARLLGPPIPLPSPQPNQNDLQILALRSPNHQSINMDDDDEAETSFSTPESSPEVIPRENFFTRFGRLVRVAPRN